MPMQFRSFDESTKWYELRALIKDILVQNGTVCQPENNRPGNVCTVKHGQMISLDAAASILASYLYGPSQPDATNKFGIE
jgi:hypothetical protein